MGSSWLAFDNFPWPLTLRWTCLVNPHWSYALAGAYFVVLHLPSPVSNLLMDSNFYGETTVATAYGVSSFCSNPC